MTTYRDGLILESIAGKRANAEGWVRVCCPLCEERKGSRDRNFSLAVQVQSSVFTCWRCGAKGKVDEDLSDGMPEPRAPADAPEERKVFDPPEGFEPFATLVNSIFARPAWEYILRRLPEATVLRYGLGACMFGRLAGRIVIPLQYPDGAWSGWVARDWTGKLRPKYLYPPGMSRGVMFNRKALEVETDEPVLVVEGCFDALPHLPHAVACLGKPTAHHSELLLAAKRPLAIALDGDAWVEGYALALQLRHCGKQAGFIKFDPGTDPGDFANTSGLRELARTCIEETTSA